MPLKVELVATDRRLWAGDASMVVMKTKSGEVGILPGHSPLLAALAEGAVIIKTQDEGDIKAAVHGGFAIVDSDNVILLTETAELASEIDRARAEKTLQQAQANNDEKAIKRAETRLSVLS
ncbi:MAG: F0F1 ATP synthase subunit epsilon [Candidatus Nanopelagicales bacterium]